ncbi:hypothetical protein [Kitasatospora griseola]|uniref:hypothetical protein n=1 Tax=Kitasatospora griseola TaxID=2064 RepID=UPI00341ABC60
MRNDSLPLNRPGPRPMEADQLERIAARAESADRRPSSDEIAEALQDARTGADPAASTPPAPTRESLEAVAREYNQLRALYGPTITREAATLLDTLCRAVLDRGRTVLNDGHHLVAAATEAVVAPYCGPGLRVSLHLDGGWDVCLNRPGSSLVPLYAPITLDGASRGRPGRPRGPHRPAQQQPVPPLRTGPRGTRIGRYRVSRNAAAAPRSAPRPARRSRASWRHCCSVRSAAAVRSAGVARGDAGSCPGARSLSSIRSVRRRPSPRRAAPPLLLMPGATSRPGTGYGCSPTSPPASSRRSRIGRRPRSVTGPVTYPSPGGPQQIARPRLGSRSAAVLACTNE